MGRNRIWSVLAVVACVFAAGCASGPEAGSVEWAEQTCADFQDQVPDAIGIAGLPEPTTVGEMRDLLTDAGVDEQHLAIWDDFGDDDALAECSYDLTATEGGSASTDCPAGASRAPEPVRSVSYLVDETGHGLETVSSTGTRRLDC